MGTFRITVEIGDPHGQRYEPVEMLVDTGATFTKAPRELLEGLGVPVESTYTAELADGSRVERTRGRTMIPVAGKGIPHAGNLRRSRGAEPAGRNGPGGRYAGSRPSRQKAHAGQRPGNDRRTRPALTRAD